MDTVDFIDYNIYWKDKSIYEIYLKIFFFHFENLR